MQENVFRLLDLLFGNPFISPTFEEYAMFRAYVASLRSADLSRQIGVVVTRGDEVLAEGVNDCPKAFGGLYWPVYKNGKYLDEKQGRDYTLGYDSNKIEQKKIVENILVELGLELSDKNIKKIKATGIGALTEFGRVVHGEMEALLMCARNGISTKGCSMYMTTFPCHNCAKHIIAAGIKKVVYIEPYPKSKALDFYKNQISQNEQDQNDKVVFSAFKGVGPHRFVDLFSMQSIRWYSRTRKKKDGYIVQWNRGEANLRNPMALLSYIEMERSAYKQYAEEIAGIGKENEDGRKNSN
ncbi:deaminase [Acetatifactor muris]|uniref:deaminase n=1 Tax=Acetatifactor muris TaxID=879566 RepID=UPI0023F04DFF|nr:deaminase [Acetatifactor muris]